MLCNNSGPALRHAARMTPTGTDRTSQRSEARTVDALLRIGIVEDNDDLRDSLVEVLGGLGHVVVGFACAEELDDSAAGGVFDLLVVDLNLPGEDGLSLVGRVKGVQPGLRVIMMTTRTALGDRVRGYDAGADVYLPKPVDESELLAAVRAVSRQLRSDLVNSDDDGAGLVRLDTRALRLVGRQGEVTLAQVEVVMLSALARAPGQRLEHWQLLELLGLDLDDEDGRAGLAVRMTRLRGKLGQVGCPASALKSLRGSGYQLCVPLELRAAGVAPEVVTRPPPVRGQG
jgi:DNA-binding response OmpR family regulator